MNFKQKYRKIFLIFLCITFIFGISFILVWAYLEYPYNLLKRSIIELVDSGSLESLDLDITSVASIKHNIYLDPDTTISSDSSEINTTYKIKVNFAEERYILVKDNENIEKDFRQFNLFSNKEALERIILTKDFVYSEQNDLYRFEFRDGSISEILQSDFKNLLQIDLDNFKNIDTKSEGSFFLNIDISKDGNLSAISFGLNGKINLLFDVEVEKDLLLKNEFEITEFKNIYSFVSLQQRENKISKGNFLELFFDK